MEQYLTGKSPKVENATAAALLPAEKHRGKPLRRRSLAPRHPTDSRLFRALQLVLVIALLALSTFGLSLPFWSAFVSRPSLPFTGRTSCWLYFVYNAHVINVVLFLFGVTTAEPVHLCEYSNAAIQLLFVFLVDFLWLTWFAFTHLVHFRLQDNQNTAFLVLFFSPSGVCFIRLLLGPAFAIHFNSHFSATKWKFMSFHNKPRHHKRAPKLQAASCKKRKSNKQTLSHHKSTKSGKVTMSNATGTNSAPLYGLKKPYAATSNI